MISEIFTSDVKEIGVQSAEGYRNIKPEKEMTYKELNEAVKSEFNKVAEEVKTKLSENTKHIPQTEGEWTDIPKESEWKMDPDVVPSEKSLENTKHIPQTGGKWTGIRGKSEWKPDPDVVPNDKNGTNPEHKTWREIMEKYDFRSISFQDGVTDFTEVSKGKVEIADFTDDRASNFEQADEKFAKQWGCTPEDVFQWRKENRYTWHECIDCKTMQLVPTEVHGNIPHLGGISEYKSRQQSV